MTAARRFFALACTSATRPLAGRECPLDRPIDVVGIGIDAHPAEAFDAAEALAERSFAAPSARTDDEADPLRELGCVV